MKHSDIKAITHVDRNAFGPEEGEEIARLSARFLALPNTISVNVIRAEQLVGNP